LPEAIPIRLPNGINETLSTSKTSKTIAYRDDLLRRIIRRLAPRIPRAAIEGSGIPIGAIPKGAKVVS
jgi:hypothetical protein